MLGSLAPVQQNEHIIGAVYVERDWSTLQGRLLTAGIASLMVLVLASGIMLLVSHRLHRTISEPIGELARAARHMGKGRDRRSVGDSRAAGRSRRSRDGLSRDVERVHIANAEREALLVREREVNRLKDDFWQRCRTSCERRSTRSLVGRASFHGRPRRCDGGKGRCEPAPERALAGADDRRPDRHFPHRDRQAARSHGAAGSSRQHRVGGGCDSPVGGAGRHHPSPAPAGHPCLIKGDRDRLQQIVWNLLSNAVKFAPGGEVDVDLTGVRHHLSSR